MALLFSPLLYSRVACHVLSFGYIMAYLPAFWILCIGPVMIFLVLAVPIRHAQNIVVIGINSTVQMLINNTDIVMLYSYNFARLFVYL
jgi:hypothetical protein